MSYVSHLHCPKCDTRYDLDDNPFTCQTRDCNARIDVHYDYTRLKEVLSKKILASRPLSVWSYFELLPLINRDKIISLGEGGTPLLQSKRLAKVLGIRDLYIKDETRNPTWSFKDRPMTVGVSKANEQGANTLASASSGNAAAALAAYCAKAGFACFCFVPDIAPMGKIAQLILYGATVVRLRGLHKGDDPTVQLLREACSSYGWTPCPSFGPFNPYQAEGPKTLAYEIIEQFDWKSPDVAYVQVGAGGLLGGQWRGFTDFWTLGLVKTRPRMVAVQATGCAPLVQAFHTNQDIFNILPCASPQSVAEGLCDPFPWDGDLALTAVRESKGVALAVNDDAILHAQQLLAKYEGVFAEPTGVTGLAGLIDALESGEQDPSETILVEATGGGLKDQDVVIERVEAPPVIDPDLSQLKAVIQRQKHSK
ncbi:MAG: threonine synthase [Candidatus Hodarchaeota archaeon]